MSRHESPLTPRAEQPVSDVAIVGYGPTGQVLSLLLASRGHRVTIIERHRALYSLPRAINFDDESGRILQSVGLGTIIPTLGASPYATGPYTYEWRTGDGQTLVGFDTAGKGPCGWPRATMFCQPELEAHLDARIQLEPNIDLIRGVDVSGLTPGSDTVIVTGTMAGGSRQFAAESRYVVGADGANSTIRDLLDIRVTDLGFEYDWLVVDILPSDDRIWDPPALQICDPQRPTTAAPGGPGRRRFEFMRLPGEEIADLNQIQTAWDLLKNWGYGPQNCDLERHAVYTFRARWADEWARDRIILAGDAAHQMPPFAGQGLCAGLRDACGLAWRLDLLLRGISSQGELLGTYQSERSQHVQAAISLSVALGNVICVTDPQQAAQRDSAMLRAVSETPEESAPAAPPRLGRGFLLEGDDNAGYCSIQGVVKEANSETLFDDLFGARFTLIARSSFTIDQQLNDRFKSIGGQLVALEGDPGDFTIIDDCARQYQEWFDSLDTDVVVIRPDFYLFGTSSSDKATKLISALLAMLRVEPTFQ
jgi:resorcinol 4-hydroxylase (NADPH)